MEAHIEAACYGAHGSAPVLVVPATGVPDAIQTLVKRLQAEGAPDLVAPKKALPFTKQIKVLQDLGVFSPNPASDDLPLQNQQEV